MSSSSATAPCSRSSSPATPESSDGQEPIALMNDSELSPWLHNDNDIPKLSSQCSIWSGTEMIYQTKTDEAHMFRLDDLIEEHAYDDSPFAFNSDNSPNTTEKPLVPPVAESITSSIIAPNNTLMANQSGPVSLTKPVPPPASRPRKRDLCTANQRVVFPPKESCFNLPIMVPSIPEGGTKSRVETQIRITVDLADASYSPGDPLKYDRIGSWKWLKLPSGIATKKRTRKQGKIHPAAEDTLHLAATVTCASPPHNRVISCSSCQAREAKRVARKLAARVRPARSDSDSLEDTSSRCTKPRQEDTTSIVQFNCAEVLDFSAGSVILPIRLTCYCRHHREKLGFNIHFTMIDHAGRIVGMGTSRPIMITDDHKTTGNVHRSGDASPAGFDMDWLSMGVNVDLSERQTSLSRSQSHTKDLNQKAKKRTKPYDSTRSRLASRETSVANLSPMALQSALPLKRSPTPPQSLPTHSDSHPAAPSDTFLTEEGAFVIPHSMDATHQMNGVSSPNLSPLSSTAVSGVLPHAMPFLFYNSSPPSSMSTLPLPKIHRLIPACGPTHGGIEVTVLGANFCPSMQLNCVFGDVPSSSTQRWSDNTLVCVLPPRAVPGVVTVWLEGFEKDEDNISPSLFTYSDESDRALMELALQVVGLKMTGKIEDAKNVAMRIVGNAGDPSDSQDGMDMDDMMQVTTASSQVRDVRSLLLSSASSEDFESLIVRFLSILDTPLDHPSSTTTSCAITHQTSSGQTLLHLAAFLRFATLVGFLIARGIDLDVRDRNGSTALHFAVLGESRECAELLVKAGADVEIVNVRGKTPLEVAVRDFFDGILDSDDSELPTDDSVDEHDEEEDRWGDVEEDGGESYIHMARRWRGRRIQRRIECPLKDDVTPSAVPAPQIHTKDEGSNRPVVDEKNTASFVDMIQRGLAQLPAPNGIIPQLPLPNIPQLRGMPAMPWGVLPHLLVFPVLVPMPDWRSFLGEKRGGDAPRAGRGNVNGGDGEGDADAGSETDAERAAAIGALGGGAIKAAQEWVMAWEKRMAVAIAAAARMKQQGEVEVEEAPPPVYTPRACDAGGMAQSVTSHPPLGEECGEDPSSCANTNCPRVVVPERQSSRQVGYDEIRVPDQVVHAFAYQPKKTQDMQKKHDRMLLLFWLPILLLSLLWSFHNGIQFVYHTVKNALPLKTLVRS